MKRPKQTPDYEITLAGAANVGKSTVFNALTGMKQHTGNWSGKTVFTAEGNYRCGGMNFRLTDTPGTYSMYSVSPDEIAARDQLLFGKYDCVIITADASGLERSLSAAIEMTGMTSKAVLCLNMMDEAEKKGITIDTKELSIQLGIPVVPVTARSGKGISELKETVMRLVSGRIPLRRIGTAYPQSVKAAAQETERFIDADEGIKKALSLLMLNEAVRKELIGSGKVKLKNGLSDLPVSIPHEAYEEAAAAIRKRSERICMICAKDIPQTRPETEKKLDRLLTSKTFGIPFIILLFALIFYITVSGANYPSELLGRMFGTVRELLERLFEMIHAGPAVTGIMIDGVYGTLSSVVSVMLPPMAIFFPLFALLEDSGILPRIAFDLDKAFCCAGTQGKQALTMMMGFGCNACGVTGCRMIENSRDRKIAALTNNFCPCNGRFPVIIAMISLFLTGAAAPGLRSAAASLILTGIIILCMLVSLAATKLLSALVFRGHRSSLVLELPPYRRPQIMKTIVRSLIDKTAKILGRAVIVAVPAGIIIWLLTHISAGGQSLVSWCADILDPFARLMGLDGTILTAFLLGFPANEIVLPIALMIYQSGGSFGEIQSLPQLYDILTANGWTITTAVCTIIFTVMHFPCSTTLITIRKETGSAVCTFIAFALPTVCGILCCMAVNLISFLCSL